MSNFFYEGKNSKGEHIEGFVEAQNRDLACKKLINQGVMPKKLNAISATNKLASANTTEQFMFAKKMHSLLHAGVPIIQAIGIVIQNTKNSALRLALKFVISRLEAGQPLATAMQQTSLFPQISCALVNLGEQTGQLDRMFCQIAVNLQQEYDNKKCLKEAMRYPIMVVITLIVAIVILNLFIIPVFSGFFARFGAELPLITKLLLASSTMMLDYGYLILTIGAAVIISLFWYLNTASGRLVWDTWKLQIPVLGKAIRFAMLQKITSAVALCLRAGMPLLDTINLAATTTGNKYIIQQLAIMRGKIEQGTTFTLAAAHSGVFTDLAVQMVAIGEENGALEHLLNDVAEFYQGELDYWLKLMRGAIEPILLGIIAAFVLFLALGIFLPMWDLSSAVLS